MAPLPCCDGGQKPSLAAAHTRDWLTENKARFARYVGPSTSGSASEACWAIVWNSHGFPSGLESLLVRSIDLLHQGIFCVVVCFTMSENLHMVTVERLVASHCSTVDFYVGPFSKDLRIAIKSTEKRRVSHRYAGDSFDTIYTNHLRDRFAYRSRGCGCNIDALVPWS